MALFKSLYCPATRRDGGTCKTYFGNVQSGVEVAVQILCRNHKKHASKCERIEFRQDAQGNVSYREVPQHEHTQYDDDGVRVADVSGID